MKKSDIHKTTISLLGAAVGGLLATSAAAADLTPDIHTAYADHVGPQPGLPSPAGTAEPVIYMVHADVDNGELLVSGRNLDLAQGLHVTLAHSQFSTHANLIDLHISWVSTDGNNFRADLDDVWEPGDYRLEVCTTWAVPGNGQPKGPDDVVTYCDQELLTLGAIGPQGEPGEPGTNGISGWERSNGSENCVNVYPGDRCKAVALCTPPKKPLGGGCVATTQDIGPAIEKDFYVTASGSSYLGGEQWGWYCRSTNRTSDHAYVVVRIKAEAICANVE